MALGNYAEENAERWHETSWDTEDQALKQIPAAPAAPRLRYCPLCFEGYLEEDDLDNHIAKKHGKQHVYLKVNDRIVRDIIWLKRPLKKCKLVLLQVPSLEFELNVNGYTSCHSIYKTTSLMKQISSLMKQISPNGSERKITIHTQKGEGSHDRCYQIFLGKQPEFCPERIDDELIALMRKMKQDRDGDFVGTRGRLDKKELNELEVRYLDGLLAYCHGWQLETQNNPLARDHLEEAMGRLMPFQTDLANDARCALSMRMNCFEGQWGCGDGSLFRDAEFFFCRRPFVAHESRHSLHSHNTPILLDNVSQRILEAVKEYYLHNDANVLRILDSIQQDRLVRDRNDEDKLHLIEARTQFRLGDTNRSKQAYGYLRDHPQFGEEATEFINSRE